MSRGEGSVTTDLASSGVVGPSTVRRFWIFVESGPDAGKTFPSSGERVAIGTHESADVVLHDSAVSRFHCEITLAGERVVLTDLGSRNGTLVDGVSVLSAPLRARAAITIGRTQLRFEAGDEQVSVPISANDRFGLAVGRSTSMRRVFAVLERVATTDATVLLQGETGTGKELFAESLHRESARAQGPFVVVDCGAIPRDLLESELFGHERGAFTGAVAARQGAFEAAGGGTVFLDEIGELAPELQPKLLRALERREVKRVGGNQYARFDARVVAATNRSLKTLVNEQAFRSDLYYRLAVVEVSLPPLRERLDDLPLLVEHILGTLGAAKTVEADLLRTPDFLSGLRPHGWPGNVRELRNYVERCLALRQSMPPGGSDGADEAPVVDLERPFKSSRDRWLRTFERQYLEGMLARHGNNVTAAARASGVDRIQFYRLLWKHGLR